MRFVLKNLSAKTVAPEMDQLIALVHRPKESFFLVPQVNYLHMQNDVAEVLVLVTPMAFFDVDYLLFIIPLENNWNWLFCFSL